MPNNKNGSELVHLCHLIIHVQTNTTMSTSNSGFFNSGSTFLQAANADFHNRENLADQRHIDEPKYRVVEANGTVHHYLDQQEMERLCMSSPGCRVTKEQ